MLLVIAQEEGLHYRYFPTLFSSILYLQQAFYTFQIQFSLTVGFVCKNSDANRIAAIQMHADFEQDTR